jgi:hypothetical protein
MAGLDPAIHLSGCRCPSPKLGAFVPRNGPPDHFVRYREPLLTGDNFSIKKIWNLVTTDARRTPAE